VSEGKFKKAWAYISISGIALFALTFLPVLLLVHDALVWGTDRQFAKYDSLGTIFLAIALFLSSGLILSWSFASALLVRFTDDGVWQRNILNWKFIAWNDVAEIRQVAYGVHVCTANRKIILAQAVYSNWNEVVEFITQKISARGTQQI